MRDGSQRPPQSHEDPFCELAHPLLYFGEGILDRAEIRATRWQVQLFDSGPIECQPDCRRLLCRKVFHDQEVTRSDLLGKCVIDLTFEDPRVHGHRLPEGLSRPLVIDGPTKVVVFRWSWCLKRSGARPWEHNPRPCACWW